MLGARWCAVSEVMRAELYEYSEYKVMCRCPMTACLTPCCVLAGWLLLSDGALCQSMIGGKHGRCTYNYSTWFLHVGRTPKVVRVYTYNYCTAVLIIMIIYTETY